jgi:hypothetical protein
MSESLGNQAFFEGLKALAESAFPKRCSNCGKVFQTPEQFIAETVTIREDITGLKQSFDDDDLTIVEVYRNCTCGSTLMDFFSDRRDVSVAGAERRELFNELRSHLQGTGLTPAEARLCLLRVLRGEGTDEDRKMFDNLKRG